MKISYDKKFYQTNAQVSTTSATAMLAALLEVYRPATVLDVGCGIGTWGKAWHALGGTGYHGVDGDYVRRDQLMIDAADFTAHDLSRPLSLGKKYDLALCMEVGEHLPAEAAAVLVGSLCAHARVVLFSAAIPFQGGVDHVNEQWQTYWAKLFADRGFAVYDCIRPRVWAREDVAEYYQQNALVYVDQAETVLTERFQADRQTGVAMLDLVHPASYRIKSDPLRWPLPVILRHLPAIVLRVFRNRVLSR